MQKTLRNLRSFLLAGASAAVLTACGPATETPDAGPVDEWPDNACGTPADCNGGGFICDNDHAEATPDYGICVRVLCLTDAHCDESEKCDTRRGICVNKFTCDPGNPSEVCQAGEACIYEGGEPRCVNVSELPQPAACRLSPNPAFVANGGSLALEATGLLSDGRLVPQAEFTYAVTAGEGTVNADGVLTASCASGTCTTTVTATSAVAAGVTCTSDVTVYADVPAGDVRVVVFDQTSGAPLANAKVAVTSASGTQEATTDADGVASWTIADATAVSTFADGYQWQTVMLAAGMNDVALYTTKIVDATKVAGVKGTFDMSATHTTGDIQLGLAGMAIPNAITELDFNTLIGELANYQVDIDGVTDGPTDVPLPSGLVISVGPSVIKDKFVAFGNKGPSVLWALGGKIQLADIGEIITKVTADTENINAGQILSAVLPFFARFDHAVVSGLDLTETDRPAAPGNDMPTPHDAWNMPELTGSTAVKPNTLLSQSVTYDMPKLPCAPGALNGGTCATYSSGAIMLTGSVVPGVGVVPLGLTAGLDDPDSEDGNDQVDGIVDVKDLPSGKLIADYAPPHDGLEGSDYMTVAIALDIDSVTDGNLSASVLTHIAPNLADGSTFPSAQAGSFLDFPTGTFNTGAAASFTGSAVAGGDFYRVQLDADGDVEKFWNIWYQDGAATINISSLKPASVTESREDAADVQVFKLGTGYSGATPADFGALASFNGTDMNNMLYYMGGFASLGCAEATAEVPNPPCLEQGPQ